MEAEIDMVVALEGAYQRIEELERENAELEQRIARQDIAIYELSDMVSWRRADDELPEETGYYLISIPPYFGVEYWDFNKGGWTNKLAREKIERWKPIPPLPNKLSPN